MLLQVDVLLPQELYDLVGENVNAKIDPLEYSRVILPLRALLEGDFFNSYIKAGNVCLFYSCVCLFMSVSCVYVPLLLLIRQRI